MTSNYQKFVLQKYSDEFKELIALMDSHKNINGTYKQVMNLYKCTALLTSIPNFTFVFCNLQVTLIWRIIMNINELSLKANYNEYNLIKLNEALTLILNGYQLSDQDRESICNLMSLPKNTKIENFIYKSRFTYMQSYICKKLLPFWKDRLDPECIEYVTSNIENAIKATNEFITKEDLINQVYFANPRPENWREQLICAEIPFDEDE